MHMTQVETWIRERAYAIWEIEGRPEGRERQHWEQATREVMARGRGSAAETVDAKGPAKPASKATDGKRKSNRGRKSAA